MVENLTCKHDISIKEKVAEMADAGMRWDSISSRLAISRSAVKRWIMTYRATGADGLLNMGSSKRSYDYEAKLSAARAHMDDGRALQDVMAAYGIASRGVLQRWCRAYREGGAEALRPKRKGRPPGTARAPRSREQELEERVRKLEAEIAYLKNERLEGGETASSRERPQIIAEFSGQGHPLVDLLGAAGMARLTYCYALKHPPRPTRPELWRKAVEIFNRTANGCGHRQIAMYLRAEEGAVIADKTVLKMMCEIGISCGIRRETDHRRCSSCKGVVGETFENVYGHDFAAEGCLGEDGDRRHRVQAELG